MRGFFVQASPFTVTTLLIAVYAYRSLGADSSGPGAGPVGAGAAAEPAAGEALAAAGRALGWGEPMAANRAAVSQVLALGGGQGVGGGLVLVVRL